MRCERYHAELPEGCGFGAEVRAAAMRPGPPKSPFQILVPIIAGALMISGTFAFASEQRADGLRHCSQPGQFGKICVEVSSRLPDTGGAEYGPGNLVDHNPATAWLEGAPGNGIGEWVSLTFDHAMKFSRIFINSGYCKSEDVLLKNSAPRTIRITTEAGEHTVDLERTIEQQTIRLPAPVVSRWIKFEIKSVYPGSKYRDTAISEIVVDLEEFNYEPTGERFQERSE